MTDTKTPLNYTLDAGIATLALDDGKANVMSLAMLKAIDHGLDRAEADGARVVLLQGREGMFSAGYDLKLFQQPVEVILATLRAGGELVLRLFSYPKPVVVACTGHAIAQGGFMLLATDLRVAADGPFKIGLNEVVIGLTIPHYGVEVARARLSPQGLQRATLTGALFAPQTAQSLGFVDELVAPEAVVDSARAHAEALCRVDPTAHVGTKARVRREAIAAIRRGVEQELVMPAAS